MANFKKSSEAFSNFSPVKPSLVFTSPTAIPTSSKLSGALAATFFE